MTEIADCYSGGERHWMERGQLLRARALAPLLSLASRVGLRPDHVTLASLAAGLAACVTLDGAPGLAMGLLAAHVFLDGLDGPLARKLGTAGRRGSLTDTAVDQVVVTATTLTLASEGLVSATAAGAYSTAYLAVVALAMVRNALAVPYSWLVRPRFVVYAWIPVELWLWPGTIEPLIIAASVLLSWKALTGFLAVRRRL